MNLQTAHDLTRVRNEMRHRPVAPVRGARRSVRAD
jgi:hypothetical protein